MKRFLMISAVGIMAMWAYVKFTITPVYVHGQCTGNRETICSENTGCKDLCFPYEK